MNIWIVAIAFLVIIIVIYTVSWYFNKQRTKAFELLAESLNFTFTEKGDNSLMDTLGGFHLFSQGYSRRISNVLTGKFNLLPVTIMDYKYTTGGGKNSHTWQQTVLVLEPDKLKLPRFGLRPENLFDKIGSFFGSKDINFETAPVFSKRYLLRGDDEESIRSLFNQQVLEYYEQHAGLGTECDGVKLIYYRTSKRVPPEKTQDFLQEGYDLFTLFQTK
jgi:hypothetical protein